MNTNYWKNQRVVITGGTSGLGKALALALNELGARVVIVARDQANLKQTAAHTNIHPIQADVANKHDIHRISGEALGVLGGIDFLFNNASYLGETPLKLLLDTECEDMEQVLTTNLIGPFRLTKTFLPSMLLQHRGAVVNISSDAAVSAYPQWGSYAASKAALDHLTRVWGEELGEQGVRFLAIDPGDMHTPMHLAAIPDADVADLYEPTAVAQDLLEFLSQENEPTQVRYGRQAWVKEEVQS
ncbi:MAG: NAD(P)-dependent dehydrogenase (short-subunit alcohol dehydrogenase family) [Cellvibrionaceae bacterium]|jgi:NAD(P)-dependent dehydrogenase (short-subunit alcohol dehydrogenase family)